MIVYRGAAKLSILIEFSNPNLVCLNSPLHSPVIHCILYLGALFKWFERPTAPWVHELVKVYLKTKFLDFGFSSFSLGSVTFQMVYRKVFQTFQTVKHFGQIKFLSKVLWCLNFVSRSKSEYHVWLFASVWRLGFFADFKLFGVRWPNRIGFAELATVASFTSRLVSLRTFIHPWKDL